MFTIKVFANVSLKNTNAGNHPETHTTHKHRHTHTIIKFLSIDVNFSGDTILLNCTVVLTDSKSRFFNSRAQIFV